MKRFTAKHLLAVAASTGLMTLSTSANTILAPGSNWEYTFTDPTGNASWNTTSGGWSVGPAPFGSVFSGDFGYQNGTFWAGDNSGSFNDDLWVRTTVDLTGYDLSSIQWDLGVDNGYKLYLNGNLVSSANEEGYTSRWEYSGALSGATAGVNYIAVALEDHGAPTAFDMQITGNRVPDTGATLALFGLALAPLGWLSRRSKKSD